jgi:hypothetical protein
VHTFDSPRFICFIDDQASADGRCKLVELLSYRRPNGSASEIRVDASMILGAGALGVWCVPTPKPTSYLR